MNVIFTSLSFSRKPLGVKKKKSISSVVFMFDENCSIMLLHWNSQTGGIWLGRIDSYELNMKVGFD